MDKLKESIKSLFKPKQPTYKQYTASDLQMIAMKTRIVLEEIKNKLYAHRKQKDSKLKHLYNFTTSHQANLNQIQNNSIVMYQLLQQFGQKIIQIQSISILIELVKKIQNSKNDIINKKANIDLLKHQIRWFQAILWFRKCKNVQYIDEIHKFCFNYFKGIDITTQLGVNCQLFRTFPVLANLSKKTNQINVENMMLEIRTALQWDLDEHTYKNIIRIIRKQPINSGENMTKSSIKLKPYHKQPQQQPIKQTHYPNINHNNNNNNHKNQQTHKSNLHNSPDINHETDPQKIQKKSNVNTSKGLINLFMKSSIQKQSQKNNQEIKPTINQKQQKRQIYNQPNFKKIKDQNQRFNGLNSKINQQYSNNYESNLSSNHQLLNDKRYKNDQLNYHKNQNQNNKNQPNTKFIIDTHSRMLRSNLNQINDQFQYQHEKEQKEQLRNQKQQKIIQQDFNKPNIKLIQDNNDRILSSRFNNFESDEVYPDHQSLNSNHQLLEKLSNKQNQKIVNKEEQDQNDSLEIIRKLFDYQQKPIKKPYMVSVYARKQFMDGNK